MLMIKNHPLRTVLGRPLLKRHENQHKCILAEFCCLSPLEEKTCHVVQFLSTICTINIQYKFAKILTELYGHIFFIRATPEVKSFNILLVKQL